MSAPLKVNIFLIYFKLLSSSILWFYSVCAGKCCRLWISDSWIHQDNLMTYFQYNGFILNTNNTVVELIVSLPALQQKTRYRTNSEHYGPILTIHWDVCACTFVHTPAQKQAVSWFLGWCMYSFDPHKKKAHALRTYRSNISGRFLQADGRFASIMMSLSQLDWWADAAHIS